MTNTTESNITDYISYFQHQLQIIENHCPASQDGELHSRVLYMAILDAISRTVFTHEGNRDRIVNFASDFCDWPECNRVSLSHLDRLVRNKLEPELIPLRDFANISISQWIPASKIPLTQDPVIADVEKLWPIVDGKPRRIDGVCLNWLQHSHLLYTYRNNLIHEFRISGPHVEIWDEDEPYYAYLIEYENDNTPGLKQSWELQYTAKFFKRLCASGLSILDGYLRKNGIDPFKSIDWGNYWIRELNQ